MAYLNCHIYSHALFSNISFNLCLPTPTSGDPIRYETLARDYGYDRGLPVLYLLHGMYGDAYSWERFSCVDRFAQDRRIAVVMCSAGNDFYQNVPGGLQWETFFTRELPAYLCGLFPISPRREDTFIAGLSMGGYGAFHLALTRPDLFSKAASLSGALDLVSLVRNAAPTPQPSPFQWATLLADPEKLEGSDSDLFAQFEKCQAAGCAPELFQACGTEDFLYQMNIQARDRLLGLGAKLTWKEGPGGHEWNFWNTWIQQVLDWLLTDHEKKDSAVIMG